MFKVHVNRVLILAAIAIGLALALGLYLWSPERRGLGVWHNIPYISGDEDGRGAGEGDSGSPSSKADRVPSDAWENGSFPFENLEGESDGEEGPEARATPAPPVTPTAQRFNAEEPGSSDSDGKGGAVVSIPEAPTPAATNDFLGGVTTLKPLLFGTARADAGAGDHRLPIERKAEA